MDLGQPRLHCLCGSNGEHCSQASTLAALMQTNHLASMSRLLRFLRFCILTRLHQHQGIWPPHSCHPDIPCLDHTRSIFLRMNHNCSHRSTSIDRSSLVYKSPQPDSLYLGLSCSTDGLGSPWNWFGCTQLHQVLCIQHSCRLHILRSSRSNSLKYPPTRAIVLKHHHVCMVRR